MLTVERAKRKLRITHNYFDADITTDIETAHAEMRRLGVDEGAVEETLVDDAIITFLQIRYADNEKEIESFTKSWETQVDGLRKSK